MPLPQSLKSNLSEQTSKLHSIYRQVKQVAPSNLHLTLRFLGDVSVHDADRLSELFNSRGDFDLQVPCRLRGLGSFSGSEGLSVIWCGLHGDFSKIETALKLVDSLIGTDENQINRKFHPHITLARIRKGACPPKALFQYVESHKEINFGQDLFDRISLFSSELKPEGPVYTELAAIKLIITNNGDI